MKINTSIPTGDVMKPVTMQRFTISNRLDIKETQGGKTPSADSVMSKSITGSCNIKGGQ